MPEIPAASRGLKITMFVTDLGFLAYWVLSATGVVSVGTDRTLVQWNWSFLGLDLLAIAIGLGSLLAAQRRSRLAAPLIIISLTLTSAAGLMALSFWMLRLEFDLAWWIPNLWLFLFPMAGLRSLLRGHPGRPSETRHSRRRPWATCSSA